MLVRTTSLLIIAGLLFPGTFVIGLFLANLANFINVWLAAFAGYSTPEFIQKFTQNIIGGSLGGALAGFVIVFLTAKLRSSIFRWWVPLIFPVCVITFNSLEILLRISEGMWNTILWWRYFASFGWLAVFVFILATTEIVEDEKYYEANKEDKHDEVNEE